MQDCFDSLRKGMMTYDLLVGGLRLCGHIVRQGIIYKRKKFLLVMV